MMVLRIISLLVIATLSVANCGAEVLNGGWDEPSSIPTVKDISWTARGGILVKGWLVLEDDYGSGEIVPNEIVTKTKDTLIYRNELVQVTKTWTLKNGGLRVKQDIKPVSQEGITSEFKIKIKTMRLFEQFYTPYAFSSPKVTGKWIKSWDIPEIKCGYHGAYSNSMQYWLLTDGDEGVLFNRVAVNGYPNRQGGIERASGDFTECDWPIAAYGYWDSHYGNAVGPPDGATGWMKNVYPKDGGSAEYLVQFFDKLTPAQMAVRSEVISRNINKKYEMDVFAKGWEKYHKRPKEPIAFFAFVGANWGGSVKKMASTWTARLAEMRKIVDEKGMKDSTIYFWLQIYDAADDYRGRAGWGYFPLEQQEIKDFYKQIRAQVHDVKLGVYVHPWYAAEESDVYKQHPEWFTSRNISTDGGENGYCGKLPEWGKWLCKQMPPLLEAYGLDFIFFDGLSWAPRWNSTIEQCREFFGDISDTLHANGAEFVANGNVPHVDIGMYEYMLGQSAQSDQAVSENFDIYTYHDQVFAPFFFWHAGKKETEVAGQSVLKYYLGKTGFVMRWPIHFGGEEKDQMLRDYFTPWINARAKALREKGIL
jgi:hypothetical protein